jgi:elongation factor P
MLLKNFLTRTIPPKNLAQVVYRHVSISANELREGDIIQMENNALWKCMSRVFSRNAQGRAYIQAEFRHAVDNITKPVRLRSDEVIEKVELDPFYRVNVLYVEGSHANVMHEKTFEQLEIPLSVMGDQAKFLQDGMILGVESFKGVPIQVSLPLKVTVEVAKVTDQGVAMDASNQIKVRVPKFVKAGDRIIVDTRTGEYSSKE